MKMTAWGALALCVTGCGPMLSTMTPAAVTPRGSFRGAGGFGAEIATGPVLDAIDSVETLATRVANNQSLTSAEQTQLTERSAALVIAPPSFSSEFQLRYGVYDRIDVGLRWVGSNFRLDARYQFLSSEQGAPFDLSAGLGLGIGVTGLSLPSPIDDVIDLDDYLLFTADVPVLAGWSGRFGHFWFGPKVVFGRAGTAMSIRFSSTDLRVFDLSGTTFYYGAQIGGAVGYRWFWVAAELSILGLSGSASMTLPGMSYSPSFGGVAIAPSVALLLQI